MLPQKQVFSTFYFYYSYPAAYLKSLALRGVQGRKVCRKLSVRSWLFHAKGHVLFMQKLISLSATVFYHHPAFHRSFLLAKKTPAPDHYFDCEDNNLEGTFPFNKFYTRLCVPLNTLMVLDGPCCFRMWAVRTWLPKCYKDQVFQLSLVDFLRKCNVRVWRKAERNLGLACFRFRFMGTCVRGKCVSVWDLEGGTR